jgi:hypothetical protein
MEELDMEWSAEQAQAVEDAPPIQIGPATLSVLGPDDMWIEIGKVDSAVMRRIPGISQLF